MGSFKRNGQSRGPNRRRNKSNPVRQGFLGIESLESRRLLSGGGTPLPAPYWTPTSSDISNVQSGPMANLGQDLIGVYESYLSHQGQTSQLPGQFPTLRFQGTSVLIAVNSLGGDFSQFQTSLQNLGMKVVASSSYYGEVDGWLPINNLPTVAEMAQTMAGRPVYTPQANQEYQGVAWNEAEVSTLADVARTQYNVDGTGVTLGVLSTSANDYNGGLAASYATGDLSASNPVNVLQDYPAGNGPGDSDEGRAMMENIHDIAPGASLQARPHSSANSGSAQNIQALQKAGSQIIVDDIGYFDEPMFQDGEIAQSVTQVTSAGATYFSAAGNEGPDSGYLSSFRPANGSVGGTTGTWMNFNPSGTTLELPITTSISNAVVSFEFDQPYKVQEPANDPNAVTSQLNFDIVNSAGAIVATGNTNNVATQQPYQQVVIPTAGSYFVAVQLVSGPAPGHIEFVGNNDTNGAFNVSTQFGTAGATEYPSSYGHATASNTIGVGAVPWWAPAPYLGQNPLASEPFSSVGARPLYAQSRRLGDDDAGGRPEPHDHRPRRREYVVLRARRDHQHEHPAIPRRARDDDQPLARPAELLRDVVRRPQCRGHRRALMKQLVPSLTPSEIKAGLIASASSTPMNGAAAGSWNVEGGYGLVQATSALNAVDLLRVQATFPANGATVTNAPSVIQVTFNKPVVFSTLSAADLTFTSAPAGVTVIVGAPIAVDNPNDPTIVDFPISFAKALGILANGNYSFTVQSPAGKLVVAEDGKDLVPSGTIAFALADTTAPKVTNASVSGRTVTITFSKALDPSTVTLGNIFVLREGGATVWPPNPSDLSSYIDLNNDPRATISYNPLTFTVTLDYSNLPQTELPSDNYAIVVLSPTTPGATGVTDLVGNALDGYYTNSFPTTAFQGQPYDFIDNLGFEALQAPQITTFQMTAATDTSIPGDQNTNDSEPSFIGQIYVPFPGSVSGDQVYIQFQGLQAPPNYLTNLAVGGGGRGFVGNYDVQVTTNASGSFSVTAPSALPEGFQDAVAVVVGQPDQPPLPGYASSYTDAFRIDKTAPQITAAAFTQGGTPLPLPNQTPTNTTNVTGLSSLWLSAVDPVTPQVAPLGTPSTFLFPAIDPATASNISNYQLFNLTTNTDESQFITSRDVIVQEPATINAAGYVTVYNAQINVTFTPGMPYGNYVFIAHTHELQYPGLADAAGNFLDDTSVPFEGTKDFIVNFAIQNTPVYITSMALENNYSCQRVDRRRRGAIVFRAAAGLGDEHARQRLGASEYRRDRPLQPHPLRQLHPRRPPHRIGQLPGRWRRRRFRPVGRGRDGCHRHGLHDRAQHHGHPLQLQPRHGGLDPGRGRRLG